MLTYNSVKQKPKVLKSMTSLSVEEFEVLLPAFRESLIEYFGGSWDPNCPRGRGRPPALISAENCLLFILFYVKLYPLQEIIGFLFGLSQSRANELIHDYIFVLLKSLEKKFVLPERNPAKLAGFIEGEQQGFSLDGTERRIQRSKDDEKQKADYSGKKKAHTRINILIVGNNDRRIKYLGRTYAGSTSEIKIAEGESIEFPEGTHLYQDKGLQGYAPAGVIIHQPKKKPRGEELTGEEKKENALISGVRIVVEHVISGVKRLHIVKDVFRNTVEGFDDIVLEVACGLHNFRCDCRMPYY